MANSGNGRGSRPSQWRGRDRGLRLRRPGGPRSGFQVAQQQPVRAPASRDAVRTRAYWGRVGHFAQGDADGFARAAFAFGLQFSRARSTPTRAAFQRRAPTMATWPSLLRGEIGAGRLQALDLAAVALEAGEPCGKNPSRTSRRRPAPGLHARSDGARRLPSRHDGDHGERDGGEHAHGRVLQRQRAKPAQQRRDGRADPPGRASSNDTAKMEFRGILNFMADRARWVAGAGSGRVVGVVAVAIARRRRRAPRCAGRRYRRSGRRGSWRSCGARPRRPR